MAEKNFPPKFDPPMVFRLEARARPDGTAEWVVHTAVPPRPPMTIQFVVEPAGSPDAH